MSRRGEKLKVSSGGKTIRATIPRNQSMLSIVGINGVLDGGEYRENGIVYLRGKPMRKWFIEVAGVRVWEPKLKDLPSLYRMWKRTGEAQERRYKKLSEILQEIRVTSSTLPIKVHAMPTHKFEWSRPGAPWWVFDIRDDCYGFNWLEGQPSTLLRHDLGQRLYEADRGIQWKGRWRTEGVFFEAMRRSLPPAKENQILSLQFGEDRFYFHSTSTTGIHWWWEMFGKEKTFENIVVDLGVNVSSN